MNQWNQGAVHAVGCKGAGSRVRGSVGSHDRGQGQDVFPAVMWTFVGLTRPYGSRSPDPHRHRDKTDDPNQTKEHSKTFSTKEKGTDTNY